MINIYVKQGSVFEQLAVVKVGKKKRFQQKAVILELWVTFINQLI